MRRYLFALLTLAALPMMAQTDADDTEKSKFTLSSYGEVGVARRDYTGDAFDTRKGADNKTTGAFHIPRLAFRLGYNASDKLSFTSEAEYVNNTGVKLNELAVNYTLMPELNISGGIIRLPVGHSASGYRYTDYFMTGEPVGEGKIMPSIMSECGLSLSGQLPYDINYQATLSTGLNAAYFSERNWAAHSSQGFHKGDTNFGSPAATLRLGYDGIEGLQVGAGAYYCSNTAHNSSIYYSFTDSFNVAIPVLVYFADASYTHKWFTVRGSYMEGNMGNSYYLAYYFDNLNNFTPEEDIEYDGGYIAKIARSYMGEIGVNVKGILHTLLPDFNCPDIMPFFHYEYYNTQQQGQNEDVYMNPRGKVRLMSFGLNWRTSDNLVLKCNYTTRKLGEDINEFRKMNEINLSLAYNFSLLK